MLHILWEYRVPEERRDEFERAYGDNGDWVRLFRRGDAYAGTQLLRGELGRYLTIDRWQSAEAYHRFKDEHANEYRRIDAACERLTSEEHFLGEYDD